jgi:serine/threonine protein kinase
LSNSAPVDFTGTRRFQINRRLGEGGMGTVYAALDRERNVEVALKTLRAMSADALLRFKNEFREFQDLAHPNLVSVGELFCDDGEWFFTMELIDGEDFLQYVRPILGFPKDERRAMQWASPTAATEKVLQSPRMITRKGDNAGFDEARLRFTLRQLADGLTSLHEARKVHRDIKPSNVLVTGSGRVVILDFGLATDLPGHEHKSEVDVVGTVEYMAPEQAAGRMVGPAADWYAVGVILFEALTGRVPVSGTALEVLMNKQHVDGPSPRTLNPDAPEDLDALCRDLLKFNPSARPTGREIMQRLGCKTAVPAPNVSLSSFSTSDRFIGRSRELEVLGARFQDSLKQAQTVCIFGESGLGKTALVRHFTRQLRSDDASVVVLAGSCYERESVPFKAVDGVIDALSQHMRRLPKAEANALLPRRAALLAQVFPVLGRVEAVAEAPRVDEDALDPHELRRRLFGALRELLQRLADRHPLIIVIDDLQWADADSLALIGQLLRPPDAPPMLLLATVRSGDTDSAAHRKESLASQLRGPVTSLMLERMSPDEGRELAAALVRHAQAQTGLSASAIAQEAGGHPLFIDELIRHACMVGPQAPGALQLEDALWARIGQLAPPARRVLEVVALAGGRLLQQTAAQAAAMSFGDFAKEVALLRVAHFLRTSGMRASDHVEPYHDRVRKAVLSHLDAPAARDHHRRLALAFETTGQADAEALTIHWREAGDAGKAAHFAQIAAEKATKALAFDRAARFYQICLDLMGRAAPRELRARLADSLANAGYGAESAHEYLAAAKGAGETEALDLRRRAAEQLLRAGHFDEALQLFRELRDAIGLPLAETPKRAIAGLLLRRARLRLRGLRFRERSESHVPPSELLRIDAGFAMALALSTVDTIRGADLQTRQLLLALAAGEPYRIARGLALEAAFNAAGTGSRGAPRTHRLVTLADDLAKRIDHPHALGLASWAAGSAAYLEGRFREGHELCEQSLEIYRNRCTGVAWEVASAQIISLWSLHYLGRLGEIAHRLPELLKSARARGDLYDSMNLRTSHTNIAWLAADDPAQAERELSEAMREWAPSGYHLPNYYELYGLAQNEIYTGRGSAAWERVERDWPKMKAAFLLELQIVRIEMHFLRARAALASIVERGQVAPDLLAAAEHAARAMEREGAPWGIALASLVRAGVAAVRRAPDAASRYAVADQKLSDCGMSVHAAAARMRHGELVGGGGDVLVASATTVFAQEGVVSASRFSQLLAPSGG